MDAPIYFANIKGVGSESVKSLARKMKKEMEKSANETMISIYYKSISDYISYSRARDFF